MCIRDSFQRVNAHQAEIQFFLQLAQANGYGFTVECQCLFAFLYDGADTRWGEKTTKSSSTTANLLD